MSEDVRMIKCDTIGVAGTTDVWTRKNPDGTWTARMGIALLGSTQMSDEEMAACNRNPFHADWADNYAEGSADTEDKSVEAMKANAKSIRDSLFF